jgi:pimeloyl-ACP methyl ester carboxylesterase
VPRLERTNPLRAARTFLALIALPLAVLAADQMQGELFLAPPAHVGSPLALHATTNRAFQGIPSLAVARDGRLWATWYAGVTPNEDHNNYVVVSTSGDRGATWQEVLVIDPDAGGPVRAFDPEIWLGPDGRLFVFWAQGVGDDDEPRVNAALKGGVWCVTTDTPESARPKWSAPRRLTDGVMMCKPIVLSTGEWVLPTSTWRLADHSARMVVSTDRGATWSLRDACHVPAADRNADEHAIVERRDGSLWLLARTRYGIGESVSTDRGRTWPDLKPSAIPHPTARFFVTRLNSGNLLLVKHGSMETRSSRSHLTAFVSRDDGRTWTGGLLLDERVGVSYPDGQQAADGVIRIAYDYSRVGARHILFASFREEDVAAGKDVSGAVRLRQLVSEASGGREKSGQSRKKGAAHLPPQAGFPVDAEFFSVEGRPAFLALSAKAPAGEPRPWVLFAPSLPNSPNHHEEWLLRQLLDAGVSIAGIDVGESHGNPAGRAHYTALHRELTERRGLAPKAVLLGRSRGGLMTLCWAAENPEKVAAFAGIFPVCDLASWPGLAKAAPAYGMTPAELQANLAAHNPIARLAPLAAAKIPLFAIHGDADKLVPLDANSALMKSRYAALGGEMELIIPPGQGHTHWEGFFRCRELVDFVVKQARR